VTAEEPTLAELEEAITHVAATAGRYSDVDPKKARLHEELNHLLEDRDRLLTERPAIG
jgi:hypothetical protein